MGGCRRFCSFFTVGDVRVHVCHNHSFCLHSITTNSIFFLSLSLFLSFSLSLSLSLSLSVSLSLSLSTFYLSISLPSLLSRPPIFRSASRSATHRAPRCPPSLAALARWPHWPLTIARPCIITPTRPRWMNASPWRCRSRQRRFAGRICTLRCSTARAPRSGKHAHTTHPHTSERKSRKI